MNVQSLRIRFSRTALRERQAWFVPGARTDDWLSEIAAWNVPHHAISLRIVPRSLGDRTPLGVLVTVAVPEQPRASNRCRPYGRLARRLYLPVEARLEPAVDERELGALLAADADYVWHPVAGLVAFERDDVFTLEQLLQPQTTNDGDWDHADPGTTFSRRLVSIEVAQPVTVDSILQSGRDGIGEEGSSLQELPRAPDEQSEGALGRIADAPQRLAAKLVQWFTRQAPPTADRETWVNKLQQWASRVLSPEWQSARERELLRLMNMLNNDPDLGLKYALPMAGDAARGIAPPSTRLSQHDLDFRLRSKSGPADYWGMSQEIRNRLTARYRELAGREISLGRHRRAAYIYAELLGDLESAAAALKSGGHYREAAVLYNERLHRPRDAANCLEEGGLWDEAVVLYEKIKDFEKVGRLYRKIDQHDLAEMAFRQAAHDSRHRGDLLNAAKLLDVELRKPEAAVDVLHSGWPNSKQAKTCLHEEFRLLAREGWHDKAARRVAELCDQTLTSERIVNLSDVLAVSAGEYPDDGVRLLAADATRVIVSRRLAATRNVNPAEARQLLPAIEKLAPEDRLLERDCERFVRKSEIVAQHQPPRPTTSAASRIRSVRRIQLPQDVHWVSGVGTNRCCYAAGYRSGELVVARVEWQSPADRTGTTVFWKSPLMDHRLPVLLAPSPDDKHGVWVQVINGGPLPSVRFTPTDTQPGVVTAESPPWSSTDGVALARAPHGVSWMVSAGEDLVVSAFSNENAPLFTRRIPVVWSGVEPFVPPPLHARTEGAYFAWGDTLYCVDESETVTPTRLSQQIGFLSGSSPYSRVRIAASFLEGGAVIWRGSSTVQRFGAGLHYPRTAFTISGHLVAVDATQIEVYRTDRHQVTLHATTNSPGIPVAVMRVRHSEFAILDSIGGLAIYQVGG